MKTRWAVSGLVALAAPTFSGCNCGGACPPNPPRSSDNRYIAFYPDGGPTDASCSSICQDTSVWRCHYIDAGLVECEGTCPGGRVPPSGLALGRASTAGAWLARMAELEAAAVVAFEHLATELHAHGLLQFAQAALQAALDEVSHANQLTRLALSFGHVPRRHVLPASPVRSLEDVAIDNGGEGCGRERLGALINRHQAEHATDARVRRTMANISAEELRHADFSTALSAALMPRLTVPQRRRVREAQERTVTAMVGEELSSADARTLGLMDENQLKRSADAVLGRGRARGAA